MVQTKEGVVHVSPSPVSIHTRSHTSGNNPKASKWLDDWPSGGSNLDWMVHFLFCLRWEKREQRLDSVCVLQPGFPYHNSLDSVMEREKKKTFSFTWNTVTKAPIPPELPRAARASLTPEDQARDHSLADNSTTPTTTTTSQSDLNPNTVSSPQRGPWWGRLKVVISSLLRQRKGANVYFAHSMSKSARIFFLFNNSFLEFYKKVALKMFLKVRCSVKWSGFTAFRAGWGLWMLTKHILIQIPDDLIFVRWQHVCFPCLKWLNVTFLRWTECEKCPLTAKGKVCSRPLNGILLTESMCRDQPLCSLLRISGLCMLEHSGRILEDLNRWMRGATTK